MLQIRGKVISITCIDRKLCVTYDINYLFIKRDLIRALNYRKSNFVIIRVIVANNKILGIRLISQLIKGSKEKLKKKKTSCCLLSIDLSIIRVH